MQIKSFIAGVANAFITSAGSVSADIAGGTATPFSLMEDMPLAEPMTAAQLDMPGGWLTRPA